MSAVNLTPYITYVPEPSGLISPTWTLNWLRPAPRVDRRYRGTCDLLTAVHRCPWRPEGIMTGHYFDGSVDPLTLVAIAASNPDIGLTSRLSEGVESYMTGHCRQVLRTHMRTLVSDIRRASFNEPAIAEGVSHPYHFFMSAALALTMLDPRLQFPADALETHLAIESLRAAGALGDETITSHITWLPHFFPNLWWLK